MRIEFRNKKKTTINTVAFSSRVFEKLASGAEAEAKGVASGNVLGGGRG